MSGRVVALALLLAGCDAAAHDIDWGLRFEDPALADRGALVEAYPGEAIALSRTGEEDAIVLVVTWINSQRAADAPDREGLAREIAGRAYAAFAEREKVTAVDVAFRVEDDKVLYERFRDETHRFAAAELTAAASPGEGR